MYDSDGAADSTAQRLNSACLCKTLDHSSLNDALSDELGQMAAEIDATGFWRQSFANSAVFVPRTELDQMEAVVQALEKTAQLEGYQEQALHDAPQLAQINPGPVGALMGYDFHLSTEGPRLIEINTNAGGAFLNAALARAQRRCCSGEIEAGWVENFEHAVVSMFVNEWRLQRGTGKPSTLAIVDDDPDNQYLYPEFQLARSLLKRHGIDVNILAPEELRYRDHLLDSEGRQIDMVYNRLVDFMLEEPRHEALRRAWLEETAVITPNPRVHRVLANKRNLVSLSNGERLRRWGLSEEEAQLLTACVPATTLVQQENAEALWQQRRQLFFKPIAGHASKGAYRGSKLTKGVFASILAGDYIAQALVAPSQRAVKVDGQQQSLKVDVRLYTYNGSLILPAARLYQGQTTNFRTPGGGFAPIFIV